MGVKDTTKRDFCKELFPKETEKRGKNAFDASGRGVFCSAEKTCLACPAAPSVPVRTTPYPSVLPGPGWKRQECFSALRCPAAPAYPACLPSIAQSAAEGSACSPARAGNGRCVFSLCVSPPAIGLPEGEKRTKTPKKLSFRDFFFSFHWKKHENALFLLEG